MPRVERVCQVCDTAFQIPQCQAHKANYGKYCSKACRIQARVLGLTTAGTGKHTKYVWEPWMDELVRQRYDSQPRTIDWLQTQIPFPRPIIQQRAQKLGVARLRTPGWTEAELAYVHTHLGHEAVPAIAKKLGRSQTAIRLMAKRRGINKHTTGGYTANSLVSLLGWQHHRTKQLVERGWLQATRRQMAYGDKRPDAYLITEEALYRCLIAHPELIDLRRVDKDWFLDLVTKGAITKARLRSA
jgi:hypothetical protein